MSFQSKIVEWSRERNLLQETTPLHQYAKLISKAGELGDAILSDNLDEIIDGIGDMQVVLVQICEKYGLSLDVCQWLAYGEIKDRKGKMINGTFVKE